MNSQPDSLLAHGNALPARLGSIEELEDLLSRPTSALLEVASELEGDLLVLGAGGKMGPTLARMARRALDITGSAGRVIAVSRFSDPSASENLRSNGVETIACDLLDLKALSELPEAANIVFMAGLKFGSSGSEWTTWAMNSFLPGRVAERFPRSRMVAFSTGNIYGLTAVESGGSRETDPPRPVGEYAMSCLGRERVLEFFSRDRGLRLLLFRLNYAVELRYGVLVDLALRIWNHVPVDLSMGWVNVIWQGDACAAALQSLSLATSPPTMLNVTGPEQLRVRDLCLSLGQMLNREPRFTGTEAENALLSDASKIVDLLGSPRTPVARVLEWTADWVRQGGPLLQKPTHFEVRDGQF